MHLFKYTTFIASLLLTLSPHALAAALHSPPTTTSASPALTPRSFGINCQGNPKCHKDSMAKLIQLAEDAQNSCPARPKEYLWCYHRICVNNEQTNENLTADVALKLLYSLRTHECKGCGHVPISWPADNDGSDGTMNVDRVDDPKGCEGRCTPIC